MFNRVGDLRPRNFFKKIFYNIYIKTMARLITYKTYSTYAKRYGIPLKKDGKNKTMTELQNEIYNYETKNKKNINTKMLYYYDSKDKNSSFYKG
jgi:hypothetical protein